MKAISLEEHVLGIICSVFEAYSAVLFLPEEDSERHYLAAAFTMGDEISPDVTILPGKGLVGWIIHNRKPLLIQNVDQHRSALGYYSAEAKAGIKAFMGFPVPTGGVLCVDSKRQYAFSERDYKILQLFAELVARQQRLGQKDISGEIPRYFAELGVIQDLRFQYKRWPEFLKNFLTIMGNAVNFDYCAFATLQEDEEYYTLESESAPLLLSGGQELHLPVGSGITGWVFRNEQPVFAEDGTLASSTALFGKLQDMPSFATAICMPVMINKMCRGVLCMANTEATHIDESMRSFVRQAVDHLSLFLENLYLKNRVRTLLPRTSLVRQGGRIYDPDTAPMPKKYDEDQE